MEEGSEGGGDIYRRADAMLPGVVASVIGYESTADTGYIHRGVPSPYLTFIFSLDDPIVSADAADRLGTQHERRTSIIAGRLHTRPAYIAMPERQCGIQLAVHPLAAGALFGARSAELEFPVTDGVALLGPDAERLRLRMTETPDWDRRFALLADYLRRRMDRARPSVRVRPEVLEAWRWLSRSRGRRPVEQLAGHVALSNRQLSTLFRQEVGLGPKGVGRLLRFSHALHGITSAVVGEAELDLAGLAVTHGYYDQSHLVRDFRGYVGISPTGWIEEERRNIRAGGHGTAPADDHD